MSVVPLLKDLHPSSFFLDKSEAMAFISEDDRRLRELAELAFIEAPLDPLIEKLCRLANTFFSVPMAFLSLIDETHQHLVVGIGLNLGYSARNHAICDLTIRGEDPLIISDAHADPRVANSPFVTGSPHIRFYAGVPLSVTPGLRLGAFCIADTVPRSLSEDEILSLRSLAALIVEQIRHHSNRRELSRRTLEIADKQAALLRNLNELEWIANHDDLTRLLNRGAMTKRIGAAVDEANLSATGIALIVLDIDRFKLINDTAGHDVGDTVLVSVAERLATVVGDRGIVARVGGDEFAVLARGFETEGKISELATDIVLHMREAVVIRGAAVEARATLGIALHLQSSTCPTDLFKEADIALYHAKQAGRDGFAFYQSSMREELETKALRLASARSAVQAGEIEPFYQPKICLLTNRIVGFEALLRWPTGVIYGSEAMAEVLRDSELAAAIGCGMLHRVSADMAEWQKRKVAFGHVAINAAEAEFFAGDYVERLLICLEKYGLRPAMFEVEITESVFLGHRSGVVASTLWRLKDVGVSIALDDFGTGFASLTHLKQYPISAIKIDRSFIADIETDPSAATIVDAVIGLANSLGIGVVAEGVETDAQYEFLRKGSCAVAQGFLFGRPMAASAVPTFIDAWLDRKDAAVSRKTSDALNASRTQSVYFT